MSNNNGNVGTVFNMTGSGSMPASIYDPTGKRTDVFAYVDKALASAFDDFYKSLLTEQALNHELYDSDGDTVLDSDGEPIMARIVVAIK